MANQNNNVLPITPYAGTSGWSGSEASRERAEWEDANGKTRFRQAEVLRLVSNAGVDGLTWKEVAAQTGWHHGQVTGPLSVLHRDGLLRRLAIKRERCSVYVIPEHVEGRMQAQYGRRRRDEATDDIGPSTDPRVNEMAQELESLRRKIAKVEERVRPKWRSYSYTRNDLLEDLRRDLL